MAISDTILQTFPELNDDQREAIGRTEGPLLVIAGPGSGKTLVLVLRTLNQLLQRLSDPDGILLCTFTEKAAFELRDRLSLLARKLKYQGDLSQMHVGTIHGIANEFLLRYRHHTSLGNNYEVLDELTQLLFVFDNFEEIVQLNENGKYFGRWNTRWTGIQGARNYFNKITEELIDQVLLQSSDDPLVHAFGIGYRAYVEKLFETNRIDFSHQQKLFLDLLKNPEVGQEIKSRIRYVMVDEYQDTNYVQEQMLLSLAEEGSNIAVVGDEDQALYRFRGATVRNILEFPKRFKSCHIVTLSVNYRSHGDIIEAYDKFMQAGEWDDPGSGTRFRFEKKIVPDPEASYPDYPAIFLSGEKRKKTKQADLRILWLS